MNHNKNCNILQVYGCVRSPHTLEFERDFYRSRRTQNLDESNSMTDDVPALHSIGYPPHSSSAVPQLTSGVMQQERDEQIYALPENQSISYGSDNEPSSDTSDSSKSRAELESQVAALTAQVHDLKLENRRLRQSDQQKEVKRAGTATASHSISPVGEKHPQNNTMPVSNEYKESDQHSKSINNLMRKTPQKIDINHAECEASLKSFCDKKGIDINHFDLIKNEKGKYFHCNLCSSELKTLPNLDKHLKTKKHVAEVTKRTAN